MCASTIPSLWPKLESKIYWFCSRMFFFSLFDNSSFCFTPFLISAPPYVFILNLCLTSTYFECDDQQLCVLQWRRLVQIHAFSVQFPCLFFPFLCPFLSNFSTTWIPLFLYYIAELDHSNVLFIIRRKGNILVRFFFSLRLYILFFWMDK